MSPYRTSTTAQKPEHERVWDAFICKRLGHKWQRGLCLRCGLTYFTSSSYGVPKSLIEELMKESE